MTCDNMDMLWWVLLLISVESLGFALVNSRKYHMLLAEGVPDSGWQLPSTTSQCGCSPFGVLIEMPVATWIGEEQKNSGGSLGPDHLNVI